MSRVPVPFSHGLDPSHSGAVPRFRCTFFLTRASVTHSYESICAACQALVTLYNKGEGIYGNLKIDLEQSLGHLADHLETFRAEGPEASDAPGMKRIEEFVKACRWFGEQITRPKLRLSY